MNIEAKYAGLEVGYDVPALPGMSEDEIQTPCLILDLDALERNIRKMGDYARAHNMRHRAHGKMHKSVDVLRLQQELGGAVGVCCQKVSEAEVFARAGIKDVLVSNQVCDPAKIDRLARLPHYGARVIVCVDDIANVADLSAAAQKHGTTLECFVEIDCGAGRCGVNTAAEVVAIAKAIEAAPGLACREGGDDRPAHGRASDDRYFPPSTREDCGSPSPLRSGDCALRSRGASPARDEVWPRQPGGDPVSSV